MTLTSPRRLFGSAAALLLTATVLAGCTENTTSASGDPQNIAVTSTDDACKLSTAEAPGGTLTFTVTNDGSQVTEFYLLAEDGLRILGEVENISPGLERQLVLSVPEGTYTTACKPGMKGDGIRDSFTVTEAEGDADGAGSGGTSGSGSDKAQVAQATDNYAAYVGDQSGQLLTKTEQFTRAYAAGRDDEARRLYPRARVHWERIETVAESFGDLDPKMDAREADLEPGQKWTGWHRIEKDLWPPKDKPYTALTPQQRKAAAADLLKNTRTLDKRIQPMTFTVDQIANGSRGLLDEVATGKVTGEEEIWSSTDLWDFQANVDGARVAFEGLESILKEKDPKLATELTRKFAALQKLLDGHREGDGFVAYRTLDKPEVKKLSDAVNALSEPLSQLAPAVV